MAGVCVWQGRGHAWQGVCVGVCMARGACMAGGLCGRGACMTEEMAIAAGGTHPTGMHSCLLMVNFKEINSFMCYFLNTSVSIAGEKFL